MYIILVKDFSSYFLPETRSLVYGMGMETFSETPTEAVYYVSLQFSLAMRTKVFLVFSSMGIRNRKKLPKFFIQLLYTPDYISAIFIYQTIIFQINFFAK